MPFVRERIAHASQTLIITNQGKAYMPQAVKLVLPQWPQNLRPLLINLKVGFSSQTWAKFTTKNSYFSTSGKQIEKKNPQKLPYKHCIKEGEAHAHLFELVDAANIVAIYTEGERTDLTPPSRRRRRFDTRGILHPWR